MMIIFLPDSKGSGIKPGTVQFGGFEYYDLARRRTMVEPGYNAVVIVSNGTNRIITAYPQRRG